MFDLKIRIISMITAICMIFINIPEPVIHAVAEFENIEESIEEFIEEQEEQVYDIEQEYYFPENVKILDENSEKTLQEMIDEISKRNDKLGMITLDKDYIENIEIPENTTILLNLNGHTLKPDGMSIRNHVLVYGKFVLLDTVGGGMLDGTSLADTRGVNVLKNGEFVMDGGKIYNYTVEYSGAGVYVQKDGKFTINNGEITENATELFGGGVYAIDVNDVKINGGIISGNSAKNGGGIYFVSSNGCDYTLDNGTITKNKAILNGGGVYFSEPINLTVTGNLTISENEAEQNGGGIFFNYTNLTNASNLTINGGNILKNKAGRNGGGIYFSEFAPKNNYFIYINNGNICENEAVMNGGGLYAYEKSRLFMNGGYVDRNKAGQYGGGICLTSVSNVTNTAALQFTMRGGSICENELNDSSDTKWGAGIYLYRYAEVNLYSGDICRNKNARVGGGIGMNSYCTINITPDPEDENIRDINICDNIVKPYTANGICYGGGLWADTSSTCTMTCGKICRNKCEEGINGRGGGIGFAANSNVNITGGEICYNETHRNTFYNGDVDSVGGGGLYQNGGTLVIGTRNIKIQNNIAEYGRGGGLWAASNTSVDIYDTEISGNSAQRGGGIMHNWHDSYQSVLNMQDVDVINNSASSYGGGLEVRRGEINLTGNTRICNNSATLGGGIYTYHNYTNVNMKDNVSVSDNIATTSSGGGIYVDNNGHLYMEGESVVENNTAADNCGGVRSCYADIKGNARISNNTAKNIGDGIWVANNIKISENATINDNTAGGAGGGVAVSYYGIEMDGGKIINNKAGSHGGGIYIRGERASYSVIDGGAEISGNIGNYGGGIYNHQWYWNRNDSYGYYGNTLKINSAKIVNNTSNYGGGVFMDQFSKLELNQGAVITNNIAVNKGGGIYIERIQPNGHI